MQNYWLCMRPIVFEDNRNSLRYWIYTWVITTYCLDKRGFDSAFCAPLFALSSFLSLALFFSLFFPLYHPGCLTFFFLQVSTHLPFPYLSLTSLSSTSLHYEVQLSITPGKFIYIFLDSFTFQKVYIAISFLVCLMHVSRSTKTCIAFLHYWLPGE